jgi:hypothetical protein
VIEEQAPDFAAPIEAWRVWRVVWEGDGYRLGSVVKPTLWPPGEPLVAKCLRARPVAWLRRRERHEAAEPDCECGIYAASLEYIGPYLADAAVQRGLARVLGRVSLWGSVVACEHGFRASHAYPARIYVPADASERRGGGWNEIAEGLSLYDVPIEFLPARRAHAARVLAEQVAG